MTNLFRRLLVQSVICTIIMVLQVSHFPEPHFWISGPCIFLSAFTNYFGMTETLCDTVFGQLLRFVFGCKILPYPQEVDPSIWRKYIHVEKSGWMAHHGTTQPHRYFIQLQRQQIDEESKGLTTHEKIEESNATTPQTTSRAPSTSNNSEIQLMNDISDIVVNSEKGM